MSIIRLATEADSRFIDEQLYPHLHDNHMPSKIRIYYAIRAPDYYLAVADEGTVNNPLLVGTCTLHVITQVASGSHGMMNDLVVIPSRSREGLGKRLFEYLEEKAFKRLCKTIFFTCSPRRVPANKFHIALGYKLRGVAIDENGTNYYEKVLLPKA